MIDARGGTSILQAIRQTLSNVYYPALQKSNCWNELDKTPQGKAARRDFLKSVDGYLNFLSGRKIFFAFLLF